jgi:L-lactate permease
VKNPWVRFLLLRVGTFVLILAIMLLLRFDPYFSSIISAVLALAISLIFFDKQRDEVSKSIYEARNKKNDNDSDHEDNVAGNN